MDLCKATLVGNVGRDPEMRYTQTGRPVLNFSVACNRMGPPTPDGAERDKITEWFTVVCFGRLAEMAQNWVTKGTKVYVDGRLQTRSYEGRDGQTRFVVEVIANDLLPLSPRQRGEPEDAGAAPVPVGVAGDENLDDVPF
jgi:single-strand DNA-binding protein